MKTDEFLCLLSSPANSRCSSDDADRTSRFAMSPLPHFALARQSPIDRSRSRRVPPPSPSVYPSPILPEEERDPTHAAVDLRSDGQERPIRSASPNSPIKSSPNISD